MSKTGAGAEVLVKNCCMSPDSTRRPDDSRAWREQFLSLFLRSEREIFRYVAVFVPNVADAEDIVQQTALALWEKFDVYDPAQPFTPWACRFALNKARQWIERRQRWQTLLEHGLADELARRREELRPQFEAQLENLESCLQELPDAQRSLVQAYYYERTSVDTLAKRFGRTEAATYKMLQRVRHGLRLCLDGHNCPEVA
jgi:RNA polymerase sigma-70 factor (ECF subfamily)